MKSHTKISAKISHNGICIGVNSPEIGNAIAKGKFVHSLWRSELGKDTLSPEKRLVEYLGKPTKLRTKADLSFIDNNYYNNMFTEIYSKVISKHFPKDIVRGNFVSSGNNLIDNNSINLYCLTQPQIKDGAEFHYIGVTNRALLENFVSVIRAYAEQFVKICVA